MGKQGGDFGGGGSPEFPGFDFAGLDSEMNWGKTDGFGLRGGPIELPPSHPDFRAPRCH